jgi:hypothetical protein
VGGPVKERIENHPCIKTQEDAGHGGKELGKEKQKNNQQ